MPASDSDPRPSASHTKSSSRAVALHVLLEVERRHVFADEAFQQLTKNSPLSTVDRGLAFDLVFGVLRHRGHLDWRLHALTKKSLSGLPTIIVMILRLGAYQLLYLDRIPDSAAVNECVKLAKRVKGRDWSGVVNGVLRNLTRQADPPWPDPTEDPVQALSIRYSCPPWLTQRWIDRFGFDRAEEICRQSNSIPPLTLRTNALRASRHKLKERLQAEGYSVTETVVSPLGLTLGKCGTLTTLTALQEGWCYVEDEAAQLVPFLLDVQPGHRVLDACAAPGGKATNLASLMKDQGEILAVDRSAQRLQALQENIVRLGITCIHPVVGSWSEGWATASPLRAFCEKGLDRILVDAPCSGLGVVRRHPEAKWQKSVDQFPDHQRFQGEILHQVSTYLRPGGVLVYSACSAEPEETTEVITQFCLAHPEFRHEEVVTWLPSGAKALTTPEGDLMTLGSPYDMDGFFAARLQKV
ncbi:16S rRNA (cytosine(967)-C(5))-methyltransferase RsmB [Candidatus Nitronereus thalassa]|uniref:16S rRNA (cytosine(967)-C(5))-methyltransferase n=1 Tax=Candidatus Nitronereus thalassa TaxID=3020898 RepID=A0ABU3K9L1_9BACT|nr:16S rRNA (cytosine(967)-C(5))-methyltransferase RsmB [Candidatus Nitronereus thalassa]MDT7043071.1 16S rRNA (cytosine(967)-C(5))-methyltransferase RsmB [Candidatus Nitronereus thalassa]